MLPWTPPLIPLGYVSRKETARKGVHRFGARCPAERPFQLLLPSAARGGGGRPYSGRMGTECPDTPQACRGIVWNSLKAGGSSGGTLGVAGGDRAEGRGSHCPQKQPEDPSSQIAVFPPLTVLGFLCCFRKLWFYELSCPEEPPHPPCLARFRSHSTVPS